MTDLFRLDNDILSVSIAAQGAEPVSLQTGGQELLWQAGPEWKRHAPVLFPIVGRLAGDTLRHGGRSYTMTQHGFARDRRFDWLERSETGCRLVLHSDADTLTRFPFPFALEINYRLSGPLLQVDYAIRNPGRDVLPVSIGAHPAFRWPLCDGIAPEAHRLVFEHDEPAPSRRVRDGLLTPEALPSPILGRVLPLDPALFVDDAVILDRPASSSVRFEADGAPVSLTVGWHGMRALGIWSKPGAAFLCIEPWHGLASPEGFDGAFTNKPELLHVAPGDTATLGWWIRVGS